jgi:glycosyltransferase involved in cell wall biosynthesis
MGLDNVTLTGFVPNRHIPLYQAAGDILLMPYEFSVTVSGGGNTADVCSPMKMFEYMAAGRAILSSDLPVLHEVLDETRAVFCSPEDPAGWVRAFGRLAESADLRARLGAAARAAVEPYAWQERARRCLAGMG